MTIPTTERREATTSPATTLRIAVLADDLYPGYGGQASTTEGHVAALRARGHAFRVLAGREPRPTEPPAGVPVRRVPAWRPGATQTHFCWPSATGVAWLLDGADVLHANTPTPLAYRAALAARRDGVPVVMGVHAQVESTTSHLRRGRRVLGAVLARWYRQVYGAADLLTAPTAFAARLAEGLADTPVEVVSNGIVLPREAPSRFDARRRLASAHAAPADGTWLAYLGRLSPEKRPLDLLALLDALPDGAHLWIAGDGPLERRIRTEVRTRGLDDRVHLLGFVQAAGKADLLAAADLFVMPSPTELQSIATLEAMAYGCAVAAAGHPTSAVPELVRERGAGLVYDPHDPAGAGRAIGALLADPARLARMSDAARETAAANAVERSAARLEALYGDLVRGRREVGA
jgi:glycosyltransferase involved in cell wall biosynthesis